MQALNAYSFQNAVPYVGPAYTPANFTPAVQFAPQQQATQQAVPVATSAIFNAAESEMNSPAALAASAEMLGNEETSMANSSAAADLAGGIANAAEAAGANFSGTGCRGSKLNLLA